VANDTQTALASKQPSPPIIRIIFQAADADPGDSDAKGPGPWFVHQNHADVLTRQSTHTQPPKSPKHCCCALVFGGGPPPPSPPALRRYRPPAHVSLFNIAMRSSSLTNDGLKAPAPQRRDRQSACGQVGTQVGSQPGNVGGRRCGGALDKAKGRLRASPWMLHLPTVDPIRPGPSPCIPGTWGQPRKRSGQRCRVRRI
jgi:hypothetical protein